MIDDLTKLDKARRNLMIFSTLLLFLTLTNTEITSFKFLNQTFDLSDSHKFFDSYNEIVFYLLTYFFTRYVSITLDNRDYLKYMENTMFKSSKMEIQAIKKIFLDNNMIEDNNSFNNGLKVGKILRAFLLIFQEIYLNKKFIIYIFPVIYFFITVILFQVNIYNHLLIYIFQTINVIGLFYLCLVLILFSYISKKFVTKEKVKTEFIKRVKNKYKESKEKRKILIRK